MVSSKLLINNKIKNEDDEIDCEKFFEIQKSNSKTIISLYLNSEDFQELDEEYDSSYLIFIFKF